MKTTLNVVKKLADLKRLTVRALAERYAETFGETTAARNKAWLIKRILWRMQANAEGSLSERAKQRAAELADDADLRLSPPQPRKLVAPLQHKVAVAEWKSTGGLPPPGTVITRPYKGATLQVRVLETGFEYEGETYKSLSAVAKKVTGSHCNGLAFFRLNDKEVTK